MCRGAVLRQHDGQPDPVQRSVAQVPAGVHHDVVQRVHGRRHQTTFAARRLWRLFCLLLCRSCQRQPLTHRGHCYHRGHWWRARSEETSYVGYGDGGSRRRPHAPAFARRVGYRVGDDHVVGRKPIAARVCVGGTRCAVPRRRRRHRSDTIRGVRLGSRWREDTSVTGRHVDSCSAIAWWCPADTLARLVVEPTVRVWRNRKSRTPECGPSEITSRWTVTVVSHVCRLTSRASVQSADCDVKHNNSINWGRVPAARMVRGWPTENFTTFSITSRN